MNNFTETVKEKFLSFCDEFSPFENTDKIVVGFSGGADSTCLIHLLNSFKDVFGIEIIAAHINHGIRGDEALRDALFTENFCKENGIEYRLLNVNCVEEAKKTGESVEECGRRIRYDFFNSLCSPLSKIATAHNANDNAETVLFNLTRGSGLKGVTGIPPVRDNIIRPILFCSREEIEGYCKENGLTYVTDSTNLNDDYTRNKIRHTVLPTLSEINGNFLNSVSSFCKIQREALSFVEDAAKKSLDEIKCDGGYNAKSFSELPNAVKTAAVNTSFSEISDKKLDRKKTEEISALLNKGGRLQIYGNIFAEVKSGVFRFFISDNENVPGTLKVGNFPFYEKFGKYELKIEKYTDCSKKINRLLLENLIDCDKIVGSLYIRTRKSGDSFTSPKRKVTKTLKKLFNESSVPIEERDKLPVICDDCGVVWIYGFGADERCKVTDKSQNILKIGGNHNDRKSNE